MPKEIPVTGPNLGPYMQVQRRGRTNYGRGSYGGTNDGRMGYSRFDILAELGKNEGEDFS